LRDGSYYQPRGLSTHGESYATTFIRRVHTLLGKGYARLPNPAALACAEEEDITGQLVWAIEAVLEDVGEPSWTRMFSVHEEPRVHSSDRRGKRRRRLDIRIDSSQELPRSRMRYEAKRLGPCHGVPVYLGTEGIQRFLDGRYAAEAPCAGMLGYVQSGKPDAWAVKIEKTMNRCSAKLCLRKSCSWRKERLVRELSWTYCSEHVRPKNRSPIEIFHTLLLFN